MSPEESRRPLLAAICVSLFFSPLMAAGVNAILPEIGSGLSANAAQLSLVGAAYALGVAILQLICGSLGDVVGHRRVFLLGALLFGSCGLLLSLTPAIYPFLGLRLLQGLGAAMLSASGLALLASAAPPEKKHAYLGYSATAVYAGIACGPTTAGFVAGVAGWRWLFGLNFIASLFVFALMKRASGHEWRPSRDQTFDLRGALIYSLAMTAFMTGAGSVARYPLPGFAALALSLLLTVLFGFLELRSPFPVLNLRLLLNNKVLLLSALAAFINYASFFGVVFYFSFYLQIGKGLSALETGLLLSVQPLFQVIGSPLAVRLCKIWPQGRVAALGALTCGLGLAGAAFVDLSAPIAVMCAAQICLGTGVSVFSLANTAVILDSAGKPNIGQASSLAGSMRSAGQLVGMLLITFTLSLIIGDAAVSRETINGFMLCMRVDLAIFGALNFGAVAMCLIRNRV